MFFICRPGWMWATEIYFTYPKSACGVCKKTVPAIWLKDRCNSRIEQLMNKSEDCDSPGSAPDDWARCTLIKHSECHPPVVVPGPRQIPIMCDSRTSQLLAAVCPMKSPIISYRSSPEKTRCEDTWEKATQKIQQNSLWLSCFDSHIFQLPPRRNCSTMPSLKCSWSTVSSQRWGSLTEPRPPNGSKMDSWSVQQGLLQGAKETLLKYVPGYSPGHKSLVWCNPLRAHFWWIGLSLEHVTRNMLEASLLM